MTHRDDKETVQLSEYFEYSYLSIVEDCFVFLQTFIKEENR